MSGGLILGLDATAEEPSVALLKGEEPLGELLLPRRASHRMAGAAQQLLDRAGLEPEALAKIAVTVGPGSFTGIRIGLSAALGLARGWGKEVVGVDCFWAWARQSGGQGSRLVLIPLGRDKWTASVLEPEGGAFRILWGPKDGSRETLMGEAPGSPSKSGPKEDQALGEKGSLALAAARGAIWSKLPARPWYGAQPLVLDKAGS